LICYKQKDIINFFGFFSILVVQVDSRSYLEPGEGRGGALAPPVDLYDVLGKTGLTDVKVLINIEYLGTDNQKNAGVYAPA
jgi:hypothetical protein